MAQSDPDPKWQLKIHQRILDEDPTAFAELCEKVIESLIQYLQKTDNRASEHQCRSVAHDSLLQYYDNPNKFDPDRGSLLPYLRMDARGDLKNLLDSERRRNEKIIEFEDSNVEEWLVGRNNIQEATELAEWVEAETGQTIQEFFSQFREVFDDTEWKVIQIWIIDGNRTTEAIAEILEITDRSNNFQKKEVKRIKDKVWKKIIRYGERIRRDK